MRLSAKTFGGRVAEFRKTLGYQVALAQNRIVDLKETFGLSAREIQQRLTVLSGAIADVFGPYVLIAGQEMLRLFKVWQAGLYSRD